MPLTIAATGLALVCACQPDSHPETLPTIGPPSSTDAERTEIDATSDSSATRVDADLSDYRGRIPAARSAARAYRLSDRSVLPAGPVARARAGDIVLENDRAQFVVSTDDASMSPCPYGGNPVDARGKSPPARLDRDILGEICPMLNVGRSFIPRRVEILDDGRHSGTAVVAAIGESAVLDFLNLRSLIPGSASGLLDRLAFDPGEPLPLSVTVYYLLGHGETGLDVVTALRNDGDETIHALFGYLVKSGGPGAFFNPLNDRGGFGYSPPDGGNLRGRPVPFLAGRSPRASYAVVPDPVPRLGGRLPAGGAQVTVAGAAAITIGQQDITRPLTAEREQFEKMDGVLHLAPGASTAHHYR
ncbi:MAG: hypothetical protein ABEL76_15430, partial [Bradymonadaceae bacterium]